MDPKPPNDDYGIMLDSATKRADLPDIDQARICPDCPPVACRFADKGCKDPAYAVFYMPDGCVCYKDPVQALCQQHIATMETIGSALLLLEFVGTQYGLAGGGVGVYTYCTRCGNVLTKTEDENEA